jgi:nitrogen-specific signal transduction histidine kinase
MSPYTALSSSRLNQDSSGETKYRLTDSTEAMLDELAHDLRQPLSTIENLACLLQMNVTDSKAAAYIEQIQDLIEQANRILDKAQAGLFCASV